MKIKATSRQRALWTFLMATLASPFLAALVVFASAVGAGLLKKGPPSLVALDRAGQLRWAAQHALEAFVWSAWPAAFAGAVAAGVILWRERLGWLESAVAGAVAAAVFAYVSGGTALTYLSEIAFIGAGLGVVLWAFLTRVGIVRT